MSDPVNAAPPAPPKIELWTAERMREGLLSDDAATRVHALAMTVQPGAALDDCVPAIVRCAHLSRDDAMACQLAAAALSTVNRDSEKPHALACLVTLAAPLNATATRTFAAHGMAQLGSVPSEAWPSVAQMLFADDATLRQVALRAATPFAVAGASALAQEAARTPPTKWTTEGLAALALSAGASRDAKNRVEQFVLRAIQGQALVPCLIAGYSALARLNPSSASLAALVKIAGDQDETAALAAIAALGQLGELAASAIASLVTVLVQTDDAQREEAICRALVPMKISANDVPLPRVTQRIEHGPDRAAAAHCLLVSLHAKAFSAVSTVLARRYDTASDGLRRVLDQLHLQLAGKPLSAAPPATPN